MNPGRGIYGLCRESRGFSGGVGHCVGPVCVLGSRVPLVFAIWGDSGFGSIMGEGGLRGSGSGGWVPLGAVVPLVSLDFAFRGFYRRWVPENRC